MRKWPRTSVSFRPKGSGEVFRLGYASGDVCVDESPLRTSGLRQGYVRSQTAPGRRLPLGAITGEQCRDHGWCAQDL